MERGVIRPVKTWRILLILSLLPAIVFAEEVVRVQALPQQPPTSPQVQAANLAPIETKPTPQVIELKPQTEIPIKVQATPILPSDINSQQIPSTKPIVPQNRRIETSAESTPTTSTSAPVTQPIGQVTQTKTSGNLLTPININQEACSKMFSVPADTLFMYTLGAIEANNFDIIEMQSKGGLIIFKALNKEFLATISVIDNKTSMLRINPTNGVYHFAPGIVSKLFEYINYKL